MPRGQRDGSLRPYSRFLDRLCTAKELKLAPTLEMNCERDQVSSFSSVVRSTHPPIRWIKGFFPPGANPSGHGVHCCPPFRAEFRNASSYFFFSFWGSAPCCACFIKVIRKKTVFRNICSRRLLYFIPRPLHVSAFTGHHQGVHTI
jgi:hypothetical protein